ncbi:MAG TPA: cytochrome P450 [Burkholderiaceae bacterium]|nr:cytochrome P450 [Burkholderiaceae bacterium]
MDIETFDPEKFDPTSPDFNADPYSYYAAFRSKAPVADIRKTYKGQWVFSRELVEVVCAKENATLFLKPGKNRSRDGTRPFSLAAEFGDGLFFMDPKRHGEVREIMEGVFHTAINGVAAKAGEVAQRLLNEAAKAGQLDLITGYAGPLASEVFFDVMGIAIGSESFVVDHWIRDALRSHDKMLRDDLRAQGGTTTMALRTYLLALGREAARAANPNKTSSGARTMMAGIQDAVASDGLSQDEATNTAVNMALGGYLSTEFLIGSGIYNLLRDPSQWQALREGEVSIDQAIAEMLRFDAPFQMADRYVEKDTDLGKHVLKGGQVFTVVYGSANRDLPASEHPDRFDIRRDNSKRKNFGFGDGIHYCIGAPLAWTVTATAIQTLQKACPYARIGQVGHWGSDPYFRTLSKLQLLLR